MPKLSPREYDQPQESEERFRKGLRLVSRFTKREQTCKFCRTRGLYWNPVGDGFALCTASGAQHICKGLDELY